MKHRDPFASTSKALGRAEERRGQRSTRRQEETSADPSPVQSSTKKVASTASFDSGSQPLPGPPRNLQNVFPDAPDSNTSLVSEGRASRLRADPSRDIGRKGGLRGIADSPRKSPADVKYSRVQSNRDKSVLDVLPADYRYNPKTAEPVLYHLQKVVTEKAEAKEDFSLDDLLSAADNDARLHRARVQAGIGQGR
jgi:hypothetical protein